MQRIISCLTSDWTISAQDFTCSTDDTTGIATCDFSGTISGTGDAQTGVDNLSAFAKCATMALTGALRVEVTNTLDTTTGDFKITLTINRELIKMFLRSLYDNYVRVKNVIADFLSTATTRTTDYENGASDDSTTLDANLSAQQTEYNDNVAGVDALISSVQTKLDARVAAIPAYKTDLTTRQTTIKTCDSCWNVAYDSWKACLAKLIDDKLACVDALEKDRLQAGVDRANAVIELYSCKKAYQDDPTNTDLKEYYDNAKDALTQNIKERCVTEEQCTKLKDALSQAVTDAQTNQATWDTEFKSRCSALDAGTELSIPDIQAYAQADLQKFSENLKTALTGIYDGITNVNCVFRNADGSEGDGFISIDITIEEAQQTGETATDRAARHIQCIKAALQMLCQHVDIDVKASASVSGKRQAAGDAYTATAGTAPPPPGTPTEGGSANTLVFSVLWAIIASLLVLL
jgi:hypothetical protein